MDREITNKEKNTLTLRKWIFPILIIGVLFIAYQQLAKKLETVVDYDDFMTAKVSMGNLENSFNASGEILPEKEYQINAPITTQIESIFLENGAKLKKGDVIIQLNDEFLRLDYESQHDNLLLKKNNIQKSGFTFDKKVKDLKNDSQIYGLRIEEQRANLENLKILNKMGAKTEEDLKRAEVNLKIARIEKEKIDDELHFQKQYNIVEKENLSLEVRINEKSLIELRTKLKNTTLQSPVDGTLMWINKNIGKQVLEGENIARIADLTSFKIIAHCSDRYANQLSVGTPVRFKTKNTNIMGTIDNIDPTVTNNQLKFDVKLDNAAQKGLRAYTKGDLRVVTGEVNNIKRLKRGLGITGAKLQDIWIIRGEEAIKINVSIGGANAEYVEVKSADIKVGDEIIISEMKAFKHRTSFKLKR